MKFFSNIFGGKHSDEENQPAITDEGYMIKSKAFIDTAWEILQSTDNWRLEKKAMNGDTVQSKYIPGLGKVFKLEGEVCFSPKMFIEELFFNIESIIKWNPTIISAKRIKMIGDSTDLIYYVGAPIAGGLISSRDFVCARQLISREGYYIFGGGSVQYPEIPVTNKYIRGECGPGIHVVRPVPGVDDRFIFQWILNVRMNGWIPQYLVDMGVTDVMLDYMKNIRSYGDKLKEQELMDS